MATKRYEAEHEKPTQRVRHARGLWIFAMGVVVTAGGGAGWLYLDSYGISTTPVLVHVASFFVVIGALTVWFGANLWSTAIVSVLHETVIDHIATLDQATLERNADKIAAAKKLLGNRPCGFCGSDRAPIVCGTCKSIQWAELTENRKERELPTNRWPWARGVFLAEHRFKILAALLSVVALGSASVTYQFSIAHWNKEDERVQRQRATAEKLAQAMAGFRAGLLELTSNCISRRGNDTTLPAKCDEKHAQVLDHYFEVSWLAPPLIEDALTHDCKDAETGTPLEFACAYLGGTDRIEKADEDMIAFVNAYAEYVRARASSTAPLEAAAHTLWTHTRVLGCALLIAGYSQNRKTSGRGDKAFEACKKALPTEVSDAGVPTENDDAPGLAWDAWFAASN